jgi:hypothetical protein
MGAIGAAIVHENQFILEFAERAHDTAETTMTGSDDLSLVIDRNYYRY